jgi:hypothetical protein
VIDFLIKARGKLFVVEDSEGAEHSGPISREAATARRDALVKAERERLARDPGLLKRRQEKAAYRDAERDPVLKMLKNFLPRKGQIERASQESWEGLSKLREVDQVHIAMTEDGDMAAAPVVRKVLVGAPMAAASSDPKLHRELNKSPGERRVTPAATARRVEGDPTREEVKKRWEALALQGMPERKRASQIEEDTGIKNVRRYVRNLKLATKKVRP